MNVINHFKSLSLDFLKPLKALASQFIEKVEKDKQTQVISAAAAGVTLAYLLWPRRVHVNPSELVVVVTGCDSGFGLTLSTRLADAGYHVVSTCLTQAGVEQLKGSVDLPIQCDVTKESDIANLVSAVDELLKKKGLKLWAVYNNAGIAPLGNMDWVELPLFKKAVEVNYFGAVAVTKSFLPYLKKTKHSRIINVSSVAGLFSCPGFSAYYGSKHALEGMMKCLRYELQPWNIRVVNVNPSAMKTPLIDATKNTLIQQYNKSPKHIQDQYNMEDIETTLKFVELVLENPIKVVNVLEDVLTLRNPSFNNYVGAGATINRYWFGLPPFIRETIELTFPNIFPPDKNVVRKLQS